MVLEHISARWIERNAYFSLFIGFFYAALGIFLSKVLFPKDPALVGVAFTSILLLPLLRKLFSLEEKKEKHERSFSLSRLFKDEGGFIRVYIGIAAGIFIAYCVATILLPNIHVNSLFREQLELRGLHGKAIGFDDSLFLGILLNNWWVLVACFMLSLITGDGAIFLISWNASLWGTIFGITAKNAAFVSGVSPWNYLILVLIIVLPHALIEMFSYIFAGIAGGFISSDMELDKGESKKSQFQKLFYSYTGALIMCALFLLILGALVETFVLINSTTYAQIIYESLL